MNASDATSLCIVSAKCIYKLCCSLSKHLAETCHDHCYGSWYCCNVQNDVSVKEWKAEQKRRREEPRGELKMHTSNSSSLPIGPTAAVHSTSSDFPEMVSLA